MTLLPRRQPSRPALERALNRTGSAGDAQVDKILSAATAPGTNFELNREADAVAMFRAAHVRVAAAPQKRTLRARLGAVNVAVAAGAAVLLAGGSFAYAASTGHLPGPLGKDHGNHGTSKTASPSTAAPGKNKPTATSTRKPTSGTTAKGTPTPNLNGLCHAYRVGVAKNPGKALDNPAFAALIAAAGGRDQVAAYCVALIGAPGSRPTDTATDGPSTDPTQPVHPTHPTKPSKSPKASKAPKATASTS